MRRVSSGITDLDGLLGGEFPIEPDIVLSGDEGDVYPLSLSLLWTQLQAGSSCLYGSTSRTSDDVQADLEAREWDASRFIDTGTLRIVDIFSLVEDTLQSTDERVQTLLSMKDDALLPERCYLVLLEGWVKVGWKPGRFVVILDSIDTLIALMGLEQTLRFKDMMTALVKDTSSVGISLLYNNYLSYDTVETIRSTAGTFIELT